MLTMKQSKGEVTTHYQELKDRLHQRVIELLDSTAMSTMSQDMVQAQLTKLIEQLLQQETVPLNQRERNQIRKTFFMRSWGLVRWSRCSRTRASMTSS